MIAVPFHYVLVFLLNSIRDALAKIYFAVLSNEVSLKSAALSYVHSCGANCKVVK